MTANQAAERKLQSFSSSFFGALVEALSEASGAEWAISADGASDASSGSADPVRIKLALTGSLRGECLVEFSASEAAAFLGRTGQDVSELPENEQFGVLQSLVETAVANFIASAEREYGTFEVQTSLTEDLPSEASHPIGMRALDGDGTPLSVRMFLTSALSEALFLHSQVENAMAGSGRTVAPAGPQAETESVNLNLVMDVELNVTLRFGQRQLSLREVLDLTTGSVVELDRQVEEPVELLLDGTVIARGEAVVIDGNYGLRVTEVAQPVSSRMIR